MLDWIKHWAFTLDVTVYSPFHSDTLRGDDIHNSPGAQQNLVRGKGIRKAFQPHNAAVGAATFTTSVDRAALVGWH